MTKTAMVAKIVSKTVNLLGSVVVRIITPLMKRGSHALEKIGVVIAPIVVNVRLAIIARLIITPGRVSVLATIIELSRA